MDFYNSIIKDFESILGIDVVCEIEAKVNKQKDEDSQVKEFLTMAINELEFTCSLQRKILSTFNSIDPNIKSIDNDGSVVSEDSIALTEQMISQIKKMLN